LLIQIRVLVEIVCYLTMSEKRPLDSPPEYTKHRSDSTPAKLPFNQVGDTDLVIAIDFGTTFTGAAFCLLSGVDKSTTTPDAVKLNEKIKVINTWPYALQGAMEKIPTILAYREDGQLAGWGCQVRETQKIRVMHFKLGFQPVRIHYRAFSTTDQTSGLGGFLHNPDWEHPNMPGKKAVDYAADYLSCIRRYIVDEHLRSNAELGSVLLRNQSVSYVITVPAIWTDKAKDLTRQAASRAGIPESRLVFIAEPEAAALYCATISKEVLLRAGDRFVVCDAGGGTVVRFCFTK
jgi:molecular chaperone DnaK (HSP70)